MNISVTDLCEFHAYRTSEDYPLDVFMARLRRESPPTLAMRAGTALHKALELSAAGQDLETAEQDGFVFDFTRLSAAIYIPPAREMFCWRDFALTGRIPSVSLRGKVDATDAFTCLDHKLTSQFDATRYAESLQWRCYLAMTGCPRFDYYVFVGKEMEGEGPDLDGPTIEVPATFWRVNEFHQLTLWRYPEMVSDVRSEVERFAEFLSHHPVERIYRAS